MKHLMKNYCTTSSLTLSVLTAASLLAPLGALAQEKASIQASTKKTGLDIVSPVMVGGSDDASEVFQDKVLPNVTALLSQSLSETKKVNDAAYALDPSKLTLQTESDVRVYFIGEGAGYANSLGFNTTGTGVDSGNPLLIFPNASSAISTYKSSGKSDDDRKEGEDREDLEKLRTRNNPLLPGDFVDLGSFKAGTALDFFVIADGYSGGDKVYSTDSSANPDGLNHVVAFAYAMANSPYLIIGFEDLFGGGDRDFNDLLFAIDIGAANVAALTATPEPATYATLGAFLALGIAWKRRQDRSQAATLTTSPITA